MTRKAVLLGAEDRYRVAELDEPVPGPGQLALKVAYAGIQWGTGPTSWFRDGHGNLLGRTRPERFA